jgi:hypothetical protein
MNALLGPAISRGAGHESTALQGSLVSGPAISHLTEFREAAA